MGLQLFRDQIKERPALAAGQPRHRLSAQKRGLFLLLALALVLPTAGLFYQFAGNRIDERRYLPPGQLTNVGEHMLHIHCEGSGWPTVVMEAGLGGTSLDWSLVQPALASKTLVCTYDRAGLGWSEVNPSSSPRASQQVADELHTLLRNTSIPGPYLLVGLSAGGMHVQMYADRYPQDVAGLVLVDPTPTRFMANLSAEERAPLLPDLDQFRLIRALEPFGFLRILPLPGEEALAGLPEEARAAIRAVNVRTGAAAALYEEAAGFEASILQTASLAPLSPALPVTVIWHGIPREPLELEQRAETSLRELTERSRNGRFIVAEGSGHYIPFDRPGAVIEEIDLMLQALHREGKSDLLIVARGE